MKFQNLCLIAGVAGATLAGVAQAKGSLEGLGRAIIQLDVPYTAVRSGDVVPIRAVLDVAGTCALLAKTESMWLLGLQAPNYVCGGARSCEEFFDVNGQSQTTRVIIDDPDTGGVLTAELWSCWGGAGPAGALCGDVLVPDHAVSGHYSRVRIEGADDYGITGVPQVVQFAGLDVSGESPDNAAPKVLAVDVPKGTVPPSVPGIVVTLADGNTGVTVVRLRLEPLYAGKPSDGKVLEAFAHCGPQEAPDASGAMVQRCVADRPLMDRGWLNAIGSGWSTDVSAGEWYVREARGQDRAGNGFYWEPPALATGGSLAAATLRVQPGATPPDLTAFLLAGGIDAQPVDGPSTSSPQPLPGTHGESDGESDGVTDEGAGKSAGTLQPAVARAGVSGVGCASVPGASMPGVWGMALCLGGLWAAGRSRRSGTAHPR